MLPLLPCMALPCILAHLHCVARGADHAAKVLQLPHHLFTQLVHRGTYLAVGPCHLHAGAEGMTWHDVMLISSCLLMQTTGDLLMRAPYSRCDTHRAKPGVHGLLQHRHHAVLHAVLQRRLHS